MNPLFKKPTNMRFVDLAIEIDNDFYKPDCDQNRMFNHMYILAYMLARKGKYFYSEEDYDNFAFYFACSVFNRMLSSKGEIKSVLNYMKSVIRFRKMSYEKETFSEIIDPKYDKEWNSDLYTEKSISLYENNNSELLKFHVLDILNSVPSIIKDCIPKIYLNNKEQYHNIYMSVSLSLLSRFTLSNKNKAFVKRQKSKDIDFDEVSYYRRHLDHDDIIFWNLGYEFKDLLTVILNKISRKIINEINEAVGEFKIKDNEFADMSNEILFTEKLVENE